ncbi:MAG: glycosyltransferase [Armatimonadetes bacterium]|nr:glycosyltransferase [Armatimonadota bacterium]
MSEVAAPKDNLIALFVPSLRSGGAERVMLLLAQGFAQRGIAVDLVLAKAEGAYLKQVPHEVRMLNLEASRVLGSLPRLIRYLRRRRPSALLSALDHANIIAILAQRIARTPTRVVVSVHSMTSVALKESPLARARWIPFLARLLFPLADKIVAVSTGVAEDISQLYCLRGNQVEVIYNPVVTPDLLNLALQPLSHPWFAEGQPPVILGAGRLAAPKDFHTLIHAFARVRQQRPARLIILGEGEERPVLESLIRQLGIERDAALLGFVDNPFAYMKRAAVFVLSSRWEAFGNVLVEAMACGTPVVSTDCPYGPREILEGGKWGKLVPVGDPDKLAEALLETLDSRPAYDPSVRARDFSLERAVEAYLNVLGL